MVTVAVDLRFTAHPVRSDSWFGRSTISSWRNVYGRSASSCRAHSSGASGRLCRTAWPLKRAAVGFLYQGTVGREGAVHVGHAKQVGVAAEGVWGKRGKRFLSFREPVIAAIPVGVVARGLLARARQHEVTIRTQPSRDGDSGLTKKVKRWQRTVSVTR